MDKENTWWNRVRQNKTYRKKLFRTLSVIFCAASLGFFYGNLGPALPDIQIMTNQSLDVVSWLFTATNAGSLLGTFLCGQFVDRVGPQLVLFVSLSSASVLTVVFVYCPTFTAMLIVRAFTGIFIGSVDLAGISSIHDIWHTDARPYMHSLQAMLCTGGILSPLVIEPFVAPRIKQSNYEDNTFDTSTMTTASDNGEDLKTIKDVYVSNDSLVLPGYRVHRNETYLPKTLSGNVSVLNETLFTNISSEDRIIVVGETRIQYAFIIFAAIGLLAAIILLMFILSDCNNRKMQNFNKNPASSDESVISKQLKYMLSNKIKLVLLGAITVQFYIASTMAFKCYAFMPTFYILQFDWSVSQASLAMSLFWIGRTIVSVAGIYLATHFKQSLIITLFSLIYILSSLCLTLSGIYMLNEIAWASAALLGAGLALLFPSLFALTEENIAHVTGRLGSIFMVSYLTGGMLDPLYTGYLMDNVSPMWFAYLLFVQSLSFLILFLLIKVILWKYGNRHDKELEIEIEAMQN